MKGVTSPRISHALELHALGYSVREAARMAGVSPRGLSMAKLRAKAQAAA